MMVAYSIPSMSRCCRPDISSMIFLAHPSTSKLQSIIARLIFWKGVNMTVIMGPSCACNAVCCPLSGAIPSLVWLVWRKPRSLLPRESISLTKEGQHSYLAVECLLSEEVFHLRAKNLCRVGFGGVIVLKGVFLLLRCNLLGCLWEKRGGGP